MQKTDMTFWERSFALFTYWIRNSVWI